MAAYAFTDLHGCYDLWQQIRDFCQPDDTLYFLGDAADRGPFGVKIIQELLNDPRVIYLKGNHEWFIEIFFRNPTIQMLTLWTENGGDITQRQLMTLPEIEFSKLLHQIEDLPLWAIYKNSYTGQNIYMSHSGFYCSEKTYVSNPQLYEAELLQNRDFPPKEKLSSDIDYVVHGHTPIQYLWGDTELPHSLKPYYHNNNRIDLDICSVVTNKAILFNLDDFTYKIFTGEEKDINDDNQGN